MKLSPPPRLDLSEIALFLDYDGTLVPYAAQLWNPQRDPELPALLDALFEGAGGATAIVSGRSVAEIDALIAPARLPVSGTHGAELRRDPAGKIEVLFRSEAIDALAEVYRPLVAETAGLRLERKPLALALHFQDRPDLEAEIVDHSLRIAAERPDVTAQLGNGLLEFKPAGADKGQAIVRFMETKPFVGRRPVFVGDDVSDEDGFAAVDGLGGVSIRVGPGETRAGRRLSDPAAVRIWLAGLTRRRA
jgi:trehalose 6-phosphate phosphatase